MLSPVALAHSAFGVDDRDGQAAWRRAIARRLPARPWRTRFAPAPTGYLHLGHLVNMLYVWGIARSHGGRVLLRIEDHDRSRCRAEFEAALLDDLDWLGFEADEGSTASFRIRSRAHPCRQSDNWDRYGDALRSLEEAGVAYPCACTRRTIAAQVPHAAGVEPRYPGTCRGRRADPQRVLARRVQMTDGTVSIDDMRLGILTQDPQQQCGDVLVRDSKGHWTYQFAVTVDDLVHGVDVIIRGEDLAASTARQFRLAGLLGRAKLPTVLHHPLLVHPGGVKLSKSNRDTALRDRRNAGETPEQVIGLAAHLAGLVRVPQLLSAAEVATLFLAP